MRYFVHHPNGERYGPVESKTLHQWSREGRLTTDSLLEEETSGHRFTASQLPGLEFAAPASQDWSVAPSQTPVNYGPQRDFGQTDLTTAWILGAASFAGCPVILPAIGLVYANRAAAKGHPQANQPKVFNIVVLVIQSIFVIGYIGLIVAMVMTDGFRR